MACQETLRTVVTCAEAGLQVDPMEPFEVFRRGKSVKLEPAETAIVVKNIPIDLSWQRNVSPKILEALDTIPTPQVPPQRYSAHVALDNGEVEFIDGVNNAGYDPKSLGEAVRLAATNRITWNWKSPDNDLPKPVKIRDIERYPSAWNWGINPGEEDKIDWANVI